MGCGGSTSAHPTQSSESKPERGSNHQPPPEGSERDGKSTDAGSTSDPQPNAVSQGREKHLPHPMLKEIRGDNGRNVYLLVVGAASRETPLSGLSIALLKESTHQVYTTTWDDQTIAAKKHPQLASPSFWRAVCIAMTMKGDIKISREGLKIEFTLKSSKEPKTSSLTAELTLVGDKFEDMYRHIVTPFGMYVNAKPVGDEDAKVLKKEAQLNNTEVEILLREFERKESEGILGPLREQASLSRLNIERYETRISQLKKMIQFFKDGGITDLDKLYACPNPNAPEPRVLEVEQWGVWEFDSHDCPLLKNVGLADVAWTLFDHYGLISHFQFDPKKVGNFFKAIEEYYYDHPFHNRARAIEVMITTHCIISTLGFGKYNDRTTGKVRLDHGDLLSAILAAAIIDLGHPGVDNQCLKLAKEFDSTFYCDLYILDQKRLTIMFEVLENKHCDFMSHLEEEQRKDVRETMAEVLFMKANAKMQSMEEKLSEFTEKLHVLDYTKKENIRLAMTMLLRVADLALWAREHEVHTRRLKKLVEEFYLQGDKQMHHGFVPTRYADSPWTADRGKHTQDFPRGQVQIFDQTVIPLLGTMQQILPDFSALMAPAVDNRAYWLSQNAADTTKADESNPFISCLRDQPKCVCFLEESDYLLATLPSASLHQISVIIVAESSIFLGKYTEKDIDAEQISAINELVTAGSPELSVSVRSDSATLTYHGKSLQLATTTTKHSAVLLRKAMVSHLRFRAMTKDKEWNNEIDEQTKMLARLKASAESSSKDERHIYDTCIAYGTEKIAQYTQEIPRLEHELIALGGTPGRGDGVVACVRNPLAAPMPVGQTTVPDCKAIDEELFKIVKSEWDPWDEEEEYDRMKHHFANVIRPYTKSEFANCTKNLTDEKRRKVWQLVSEVDRWDFDVFTLQTEMSGSYSYEGLANQPQGGSLFITLYALMYKYGFMRKFNIDEVKMINWLSMLEAGYHPNPYHNSMHACDVLQVTHYILASGGMIEQCKVSDEDVFCTLFAAAAHDYNHPGINNSFHVKTQNYLAILWNDRSVNENCHASSVFELMRLERFNILEAFTPAKRVELRELIVELVLGTDMGLHAQILGRFKNKIEINPRVLTRDDMILTLVMAVKMADISNCGRSKYLYHGWCNQIADEFFMQGDRERLMGLVVSPFMDRYTTIISKGQTAFMNYIVVPLFECMAEFLPRMLHAVEMTEANKSFWMENMYW